MQSHLGVSGCAGSEEHYHRVVTARVIVRALEDIGTGLEFLVEVAPAAALAVSHYKNLHAAGCRCSLSLFGRVVIGGAEDTLCAGSLEAVLEVFLAEKMSCRNSDSSELFKTHHGKPELVVTL